MSSVGALLWLQFTVILRKEVRAHNDANYEISSGGSRGTECEMTEKAEVAKSQRTLKHNRKKGVNFYFLIGGIGEHPGF